ncbi:unnamed protein product [Effrenium voratum]|nr:unnamed protein product [Effrenium voratum]CAJ1452575.1 unnamed protein product [Effrenium voratum]
MVLGVLGGLGKLKDAYNAYDKFSDIHDKYEKNREQLDEYAKKMDSQMEDMGSVVPPGVAANMKHMNTDKLDWDGVPSDMVYDFKKAKLHTWVERAVKANFRASRAAREAEDDLAEATHHEEVAQAVAQKAQAIMLQAQQDALSNTMRAPSIQPFMHFCTHLAKTLEQDPSHANEPATLQMRKYCQGFFEDLQSITQEPEIHGSKAEMKLYDSPPQEFDRDPHWSPSSPLFHPPRLDVDHRLAVEAALPVLAAAYLGPRGRLHREPWSKRLLSPG